MKSSALLNPAVLTETSDCLGVSNTQPAYLKNQHSTFIKWLAGDWCSNELGTEAGLSMGQWPLQSLMSTSTPALYLHAARWTCGHFCERSGHVTGAWGLGASFEAMGPQLSTLACTRTIRGSRPASPIS